jgi:hypothetical protein
MATLVAIGTATASRLRTNADPVTDTDSLHLLTYSIGVAHHFVTNNNRIVCWSPA